MKKMSPKAASKKSIAYAAAIRFIILIGVVSLFGDPLATLGRLAGIRRTLRRTHRLGHPRRAPLRCAHRPILRLGICLARASACGNHSNAVGASMGRMLATALMRRTASFTTVFWVAVIPAFLAPRSIDPRDLEVAKPICNSRPLSRVFWVYSAAAAFIGAGYADFSLIAYHFGKVAVVAPPLVPILYAVAMVAAALAALALGRLFDRVGIIIMIPATIASATSAPLAFLGGPILVTIGVICWGIGMGAQKSVMRAAIALTAPSDRRGTAFGLFHAIFGVAWFMGSALLGFIYDRSVLAWVMSCGLFARRLTPAGEFSPTRSTATAYT